MAARAHDHDHDPVEAEPLLAVEERDLDVNSDLDSALEDETPQPELGHEPRSQRHGQRWCATRFQAQRRTTIVVLLAVIMFTMITSFMLILIPVFRLMEDAICHVHYGKGLFEPIEERLCKIDAVQKELAYLGGLSALISSVVGVVATLPNGVLADR